MFFFFYIYKILDVCLETLLTAFLYIFFFVLKYFFYLILFIFIYFFLKTHSISSTIDFNGNFLTISVIVQFIMIQVLVIVMGSRENKFYFILTFPILIKKVLKRNMMIIPMVLTIVKVL